MNRYSRCRRFRCISISERAVDRARQTAHADGRATDRHAGERDVSTPSSAGCDQSGRAQFVRFRLYQRFQGFQRFQKGSKASFRCSSVGYNHSSRGELGIGRCRRTASLEPLVRLEPLKPAPLRFQLGRPDVLADRTEILEAERAVDTQPERRSMKNRRAIAGCARLVEGGLRDEPAQSPPAPR